MSLTDFLKIKGVSESLLARYPFPSPIIPDKEMVCPPLSEEFGTCGTAVDYAFRARLEHAFSGKAQIKKEQWIAEQLFGRLDAASRLSIIRYFDEARDEFELFVKNGLMTVGFIRGVCHLARMDEVYRSNRDPKSVPHLSENLIDDVAQVANSFDLRTFAGGITYELNPEFGSASRMVNGADADLIVNYADGRVMLVDFKTTKYLKFTQAYWLQLVGYAILRAIEGVKPEITHVSIYYARHRELVVGPLNVRQGEGFDEFVEKFQKQADTYRENLISRYKPDRTEAADTKKAPRKRAARKEAATIKKAKTSSRRGEAKASTKK